MNGKSDLTALERRLTKKDVNLSSLSAEEQFALIAQRSQEMVDPERLRGQLAAAKRDQRPLRVKYGIDPTAREIHLGHIVPIIVARRFQQMGHHVIIIIGDFTALVGDPSGRLSSRPVLTPEEIAHNVAAYREQISRFIDIDRVEIVHNAKFYDPSHMGIRELFRIYRQVTVAPLLQREDFRRRQEHGLTIAELLYPTLMAIDSIELGCDVELGGVDQLLNFQITKEIMRREGLPPQTAVTTPLLMSTAGDGKKMSKSEGNYVGIAMPAAQVYGKIMSIPDSLMEHYFKLLTDIDNGEWSGLEAAMASGSLSPMAVKQLLARVVVTWLCNAEAAVDAEASFSRIFTTRGLPEEVPQRSVAQAEDLTWATLAVQLGLVKSKGELRRLVNGKAVKLVEPEERTIESADEIVPSGTYTIRYGRGKFIRVTIA